MSEKEIRVELADEPDYRLSPFEGRTEVAITVIAYPKFDTCYLSRGLGFAFPATSEYYTRLGLMARGAVGYRDEQDFVPSVSILARDSARVEVTVVGVSAYDQHTKEMFRSSSLTNISIRVLRIIEVSV